MKDKPKNVAERRNRSRIRASTRTSASYQKIKRKEKKLINNRKGKTQKKGKKRVIVTDIIVEYV